ncbi:hypothetical protein SAMN04487949_0875 [Halogranum gelatinilyticum]|uniref:Type II secretion system (T2SS), protein F n=1 Tax=Halogranum gelatinilyticum TaxID=660521 RepID=A0A1G9QIF6_9EURY|nr:type II secretion system protein [Halogranum gelatinilyticum]SDM10746.1 hypothetical protein SAMN04487949_0875 [Halogranum gelatinilyticum]
MSAHAAGSERGLVALATGTLLQTLARLYPWPVDPSTELVRSLGYLDTDVRAETVVRAGYGAAVVCGVLGVVVAGVAVGSLGALGSLGSPTSLGLVGSVALASAGLAAHGVHRAPVLAASARRTRALGATAGLVGRAVLRLRIDPTAERAARFAARTGEGPLADSLAEHVRRATGTPQSGFDGFAREWSEWFPALDRSVALLTASASAPDDERARSLDRALSAVLDGTRERMATFAAEIRGPATAVYAFGVLLPLALVGVLPAARVAGVPVSLPVVVVLYDVLLPLALVAAAGWLLLRRPVAFPPPRVSRSHPDVPTRPWRALVAGAVAAAAGWLVGSTLVGWAGAVASVGGGVGVALAVRFYPVKAVRDHVRAVESSLPDALYLVGRRVAEGTAVETALVHAGDEVGGATGDLLDDAVRVQRTLRVGVRDAFLGRHGALSNVPSDRARGMAAFLALAATQGKPAGSAIVAMADQLESLREVDREARQELAAVTSTLANTAAVFAPLVGGATVTLADRMGSVDAGGEGGRLGGSATSAATSASADSLAAAADPLATGALGTAVGVYVLVLAAVLTALAVGLEHGVDLALVGYRVGLALLAATTTYLTAVVAAGLLV